MDVESIKLIYFSPTRTTKKILHGISEGFQTVTVEPTDLTSPESTSGQFEEKQDGLALLGAPVYSGRIPMVAAKRLRKFKAKNTPAVVVVLYGNRAFEDALLELKDITEKSGFKVVAGGAFVGEHSYSSDKGAIAKGRPDKNDLSKAVAFGKMIRDKMKAIESIDEMPPLNLPGSFPYRERPNHPIATPVTLEPPCTRCEACVTVCPTGAVTVYNEIRSEPDLCIRCSACIKVCPEGARVWKDEQLKKTAAWLHENCSERKEPEIYL